MPEIELEFCSSSDPRFLQIRRLHYIASFSLEEQRTMTAVERESLGLKFGDRGQQAHFLIWYKGELAGIISAGGAVKCTRPRNEFFGVPMKLPKTGEPTWINGVVDNTVYRLVNHEPGLFGRVLSVWEKVMPAIWMDLYGTPIFGFETFIEVDESTGRGKGQGYIDTGWKFAGTSAGKAVAHPRGTGMNQVSGKSTRVYGDTIPKKIFCKWRSGFTKPVWCRYASSWKSTTPEEKRIAKEKAKAREWLKGLRCFVIDKVRVSIGGRIRDTRAEYIAWVGRQTSNVFVGGLTQTRVEETVAGDAPNIRSLLRDDRSPIPSQRESVGVCPTSGSDS